MKLRFITCILAIVSLSSSHAQTILNQINHPANPGKTENGKYLKPGSVYLPDTGAKKIYDYRSAVLRGDSMAPKVYMATTDTAVFHGSNRYYNQTIKYSGLGFQGSFYEANTPNYHATVGYSLVRSGFDISSISGTSGDSVIFTAQNHFFKTPNVILQYPATYKSNWKYTNRITTDFLLNLHYSFLLKYDNTPSQRIQNIDHRDSVVGYGTMLVPFGNVGSAEYDVIMVKYWEKVNDSLTINGTAAPSFLLTSLGTSNGKDTFTYGYRFYRPYYSTPLMVMSTDATYSKITEVYYDPNNIGTTGIDNFIAPNMQLSVYPNPFKSGILHFSFDKFNNEQNKLIVSNMLGEVLCSRSIAGNGHQEVSIDLSTNIPNGMYFYQLVDQDGKILASGKAIKQ